MSATTESQLEAIHAMMASGHRSCRMERHTLLIWGLTAAALIIFLEFYFTAEMFAQIWVYHMVETVIIAVALFAAGLMDIKLTRKLRKQRDQTLSFVQVQVTKIWWFLIGLIVFINLGMNFFGGGYIFYPLVIVILGLAFYVNGLFSEQVHSWIGVMLILLGLAALALQLPFPAMRWLALSVLGIGFPVLAFTMDKAYTTSANTLKRMALSILWLGIVVTPAFVAHIVSKSNDFIDLEPVSLEQYSNGNNMNENAMQNVRLPAGQTVPIEVKLIGDILEGGENLFTLPMRITDQFDITVKDEKPTGFYRVNEHEWKKHDESLRIRVVKWENLFTRAQGPKIKIDVKLTIK